MHFNEMTHLLAKACGQTTLTSDAEGAVAVAFGPLVVNIRPGQVPESFRLDARLGSVTAFTPETVVSLMAENRWPRESCAGAIGVDASGTVFLLQHLAGRHLTFERFQSVLHRFAAHGTRWRERLALNEGIGAQPPDIAPATLQALA